MKKSLANESRASSPHCKQKERGSDADSRPDQPIPGHVSAACFMQRHFWSCIQWNQRCQVQCLVAQL